jgi:hypothetical protein
VVAAIHINEQLWFAFLLSLAPGPASLALLGLLALALGPASLVGLLALALALGPASLALGPALLALSPAILDNAKAYGQFFYNTYIPGLIGSGK